MDIPRTRLRRKQLNLTPLIDVVFLLILFFMLTSSFEHPQGLQLNVASNTTSIDSSHKETFPPITLLIQPDGYVLFEKKRIALTTLPQQLTPILNKNPTQAFILKNTVGTTVQDIVSTMEKIQFSGGKNITIAD